MCGIACYIGSENAVPIVLNCLKSLEYRGYDSSGIAILNKNNEMQIYKKIGRIKKLENIIENNLFSNMSIGHTRWATHGKTSDENAHPHKVNKITLVHNGIIENYEILKDNLIKEGYVFKSETDSEVAAAYIDFIYSQEKDMIKTLEKVSKIFKGSYALGILCVDEINKMYAIKKESPLIVGTNNKGNFIASDVPAILEFTNKYYLLNEGEIAVLEKDKINFYLNNYKVEKVIKIFSEEKDSVTKKGYEHFMLKEINEQKKLGKDLIEELSKKDFDISKYENIDIISCGSAYNAGVLSKYLFDKYTNICVNVYLASEYRYNKIYKKEKQLALFISQSGETADTLSALKKAKENLISTLSIVNVKNSSIARESDEVIYTNAGLEIAVATTKGYFTQFITLSYLILSASLRQYIISENKYKEIINSYAVLETEIENIINQNYDKVVNEIYDKSNAFYIGRKKDYALALEGSLKLKEITYIHSEAFASGELKHGTIALIEDKMPVISVISDETIIDKSISNNKEVLSRGAYVLVLSPFDISNGFSDILKVKNINDFINPCLLVVVMQMLSYKVALKKNLDIDKPRNLAKSVTVE